MCAWPTEAYAISHSANLSAVDLLQVASFGLLNSIHQSTSQPRVHLNEINRVVFNVALMADNYDLRLPFLDLFQV